MKNWVIAGLVAAAGYWMYSSWFSSEKGQEDPGCASGTNELAKSRSAASGDQPAHEESVVSDGEGPVSLDLGAADVVEPKRGETPKAKRAWDLHQRRLKAAESGNQAAASRLAVRILKEFPDSDAARWIHFERGRAALAEYRRLRWEKAGLVKAHEARRELTPALFLTRADAAEKEGLREVLAELARVVLFSGRHVEGADFLYTPKRGANLSSLCRTPFRSRGAYTSPGFVAAVNRMKSPRSLRAGEPSRVPTGRPSIIVVKSEYRLYFLYDGAYVRDFPVGLGRDDSTPESAFRVSNKQKKPDWYPSAGVRIPFGDPRNILGTRWLGFAKTESYRGYGIHGTTEPASIGKQDSSGCVRMLRADIERIYDWTPEGTLVTIMP